MLHPCCSDQVFKSKPIEKFIQQTSNAEATTTMHISFATERLSFMQFNHDDATTMGLAFLAATYEAEDVTNLVQSLTIASSQPDIFTNCCRIKRFFKDPRVTTYNVLITGTEHLDKYFNKDCKESTIEWVKQLLINFFVELIDVVSRGYLIKIDLAHMVIDRDKNKILVIPDFILSTKGRTSLPGMIWLD